MEAGDSKIWVWAAFLLISFLYKAWKKKNKQQEEGEDKETSGGASMDFGLENLISQFEGKYSGNKNKATHTVDSSNTTIKKTAASEVTASKGHQTKGRFDYAKTKEGLEGSSMEDPKTLVKPDKSEGVVIEEDALDLDLKRMIVAQTILERPNF